MGGDDGAASCVGGGSSLLVPLVAAVGGSWAGGAPSPVWLAMLGCLLRFRIQVSILDNHYLLGRPPSRQSYTEKTLFQVLAKNTCRSQMSSAAFPD